MPLCRADVSDVRTRCTCADLHPSARAEVPLVEEGQYFHRRVGDSRDHDRSPVRVNQLSQR